MRREWEFSERRGQKIAISIFILAVHVLLLRVQWLSQVSKSASNAEVFLHFQTLSEPTPQPVIEKPGQLEKAQQPVTDSIQPSTPTIPQVVLPPVDDESNEPPAEPLSKIDWREASAQAAAELARRGSKDTYRSLDSRPALKQAPTKEEPKNSIFLPPQHRAGETQRFDSGEVITWMNDRCYKTNRPPYSTTPRSVGTVCKTLSKIPRGDLFESFKPDYLRTPVDELTVPRVGQ